MEKREDDASILSQLDLHDIEETLSPPYHTAGPGRPPRSPLGIFKALIVKQLRSIPSDRELYRRLWNDEALREICDIEEHEKPIHPSQLTRFRNRVGPERLEAVMNRLLEELVEGGLVKGERLALDATFIKAWSRRDPADDSHGLSDPESRVGRDGKTYDLGYKAHVAVDADSDIPVAVVSASANDNEKKHAPSLIERTKNVLEKAGARLRSLIADSQYSSKAVRGLVEESVIPYTSNQKGEDIFRVDRRFRTYGPADDRVKYHKRPLVESVFSFLKDQYGLRVNNVRGLLNVGVYVLLSLLCGVLNREAAENVGRMDKALSPTFFNT